MSKPTLQEYLEQRRREEPPKGDWYGCGTEWEAFKGRVKDEYHKRFVEPTLPPPDYEQMRFEAQFPRFWR